MDKKYIELDDAIQVINGISSFSFSRERTVEMLKEIPCANVVARNFYAAAVWENEIMRSQLKDVGKSMGEKMDDVKRIVRSRWVGRGVIQLSVGCKGCKNCGEIRAKDNYCSNCGAEME